VRFSAATALEEVRAGRPLQVIAAAHEMEEIVAAVRDAKRGLRYGLSALQEPELRRQPADGGWSVAQIVGHALKADEAAHAIARALALGRPPEGVQPPYDEPGDPRATASTLLDALSAAESRLAGARVLAAGGPIHPHRDLGELDARGWILFIGVHDALHLHQAAGVMRSR
jgi:hypothetical protein